MTTFTTTILTSALFIAIASAQQIKFRTNGRDFEQLIDNEWTKFGKFAGVNLGITNPGSLPCEVILRKEDYIRRFQRLEALNVKVIRVYSLLHPEFYQTLMEWNREHAPLYVLHGCGFPENEFENHGQGNDVTEPEIMEKMLDIISRTVKGVYGQGKTAYRFVQGDTARPVFGEYSEDISDYLIGWAVGGEISPHAAYKTNMNPDRDYEGIYFRSEDTTAFEAWVAEILDFTATESVKYGHLAPISQTNWVTLDGIKNPTEARHSFNRSIPHTSEEDWQELDQTKIIPINGASKYYNTHIYPYYPEFLTNHNASKDGYYTYLQQMREKYSDKPFLITEVGVSTSIGQASSEFYGRNHGGVKEADQGNITKELIIRSIQDEDVDGVLIFQLHDEWFKKSWNTRKYDDPEYPQRYRWHNYMSAEEGFGIYRVVPSKKLGNKNIGNDYYNVEISHNEMYLTVEVEMINNGGNVLVAFDNLPGGSTNVNGLFKTFTKNIDSYLLIGDDTVEFKLSSTHDPFIRQFGWWLNNLAEEYTIGPDVQICMNQSENFQGISVFNTLGLQIKTSIEDYLNPNSGIFSDFQMLTKTPTFMCREVENNEYEPYFIPHKSFKLDLERLTTRNGNKVTVNLPYHVLGYGNPAENERIIMGSHGQNITFGRIKDKEPIMVETTYMVGETEIPQANKVFEYQLQGWGAPKCYCEEAKEGFMDFKAAFTLINNRDNGITETYNYCTCSTEEILIEAHQYMVLGSITFLAIALGGASIGKFLLIHAGYCMSARKVTFHSPRLAWMNLMATLGLVYLLATIQVTTSFLSLSYMLYILLVIWDSLILIVVMITTKWNLMKENKRTFDANQHAFVVACHNSSEVIGATIDSLLEKVKPRHIFIADNGSSPEEAKMTKEICDKKSHQYQLVHHNGGHINYGFLEKGNKTIAQYGGVQALPEQVKYVTCIDDDTRLTESWTVHKVIKYFEDDADVAVLAYPLTVWNPQYDIEWFQAMEYMIVGYLKIFHSKMYSTIFNSGAFGTYRVEILREALQYHDTVYHGDDLQICLHIHQLKGKKYRTHPNKVHTQNYKVATATDMVASTIAPKCWLHKDAFNFLIPGCLPQPQNNCECGDPDLFKQRCKGWFLSKHRFIPRYIKLIFNTNGVNGGLWVRLVALYELLIIFNEYFAIVYIALFLRNVGMWMLEGFLIGYAINILVMAVLNWSVLRKNKMYIPYEVITIQPLVYKIIMITIYRYIGLFYNLWTLIKTRMTRTMNSLRGKKNTRISHTIKRRLKDEKFQETIVQMFAISKKDEANKTTTDVVVENELLSEVRARIEPYRVPPSESSEVVISLKEGEPSQEEIWTTKH